MALRPIEFSDIPEVISVLQSMQLEIALCAESPNDPRHVHSQLMSMVEHNSFIGFINPGKGFMFGWLGSSWYDSRLKAVELLLYVYPEHRKSYLASALIMKFIEIANEKGACEVIAGTSLGYRTDAVERLYHRHGFVTTGANLKLKLE